MPTYETEKDRENESETAQLIEAVWDCTVQHLPEYSEIDWALCRNKEVVALAEFKRRKNGKHDFPTILVSVTKILSARAYAAVGLKTFFVVRWADQTGFIDMAEDPDRLEWGGRNGRPTEVVAHYKVDRFRSFK